MSSIEKVENTRDVSRAGLDASRSANQAAGLSTPEMVRIIFTLVVVCLSMGFMISIAHAYTAPIIRKQELAEATKAAAERNNSERFKKFFPACDGCRELGEWMVHERKAKYFEVLCKGSAVGYAIESFGKGYSGLIEVLVGIAPAGEVAGIDIVNQTETPGLGDQIMGDDFKRQLVGKSLTQLTIKTGDTGDGINAITGATISSRAVTEDAVRNAVRFISSGKR